MTQIQDSKVRELAVVANKLRQHVIEMTAAAGSGHQGGPLGLAEIFAALYFHELKHDPRNPDWPERDRLLLSNGHACPILYAAMAEAGYFPVEELLTLRKLGSRLQGHPERTWLPGLESTSGPLGAGLAQAIGIAYAHRLDGKNSRTWCVTSDGEHDEGLHWEAVLAAGKYGLENLTCIVDRNGIQIDGRTEDVMPLSPLEEKYATFNWHVIPCDGNDLRKILDAFEGAKAMKGRPTVIVAHTVPGRGVSFMEDDYRWHSQVFKPGEAEAALEELRNAKL
jgi:transketolase